VKLKVTTLSVTAYFVLWYAIYGTWDARTDPYGRLRRGVVISGQT